MTDQRKTDAKEPREALRLLLEMEAEAQEQARVLAERRRRAALAAEQEALTAQEEAAERLRNAQAMQDPEVNRQVVMELPPMSIQGDVGTRLPPPVVDQSPSDEALARYLAGGPLEEPMQMLPEEALTPEELDQRSRIPVEMIRPDTDPTRFR